jgi:hypothetical protein
LTGIFATASLTSSRTRAAIFAPSISSAVIRRSYCSSLVLMFARRSRLAHASKR